jgi:hypothetical protein
MDPDLIVSSLRGVIPRSTHDAKEARWRHHCEQNRVQSIRGGRRVISPLKRTNQSGETWMRSLPSAQPQMSWTRGGAKSSAAGDTVIAFISSPSQVPGPVVFCVCTVSDADDRTCWRRQ